MLNYENWLFKLNFFGVKEFSFMNFDLKDLAGTTTMPTAWELNFWLFISKYFNLYKEVQLKMGHVQKNEVLAKFMENGEWDFHHVEAFPHSPEVEQHPTNSSAQG